MTQGLRKVESSTLKEREEEKARGALHPKCKSERRKASSPPLLYVFFSFFLLEKKKTPSSSSFKFLFPTYCPPAPTYPSCLFLCYCCSEEGDRSKLSSPSSLCLKRRKRWQQLVTIAFFSIGVAWKKQWQLVIVAFFFVFEKKKMMALRHHLLLWSCCCRREEGNGNCRFLLW